MSDAVNTDSLLELIERGMAPDAGPLFRSQGLHALHCLAAENRALAAKLDELRLRTGQQLVRLTTTQAKLADAERELTRLRVMDGERKQLLELTASMDEHPDWYDGPCECTSCRQYAGEQVDG